jgi:hypothetical protein
MLENTSSYVGKHQFLCNLIEFLCWKTPVLIVILEDIIPHSGIFCQDPAENFPDPDIKIHIRPQ